MSQEIFNQVKDAELKASDVIAQAQHEAREKIKQAQTDCLNQERSQAQEQRALYQSILDAASKHMEDEIEKGHGASIQELDAQMTAAKGKLDAAATMIFERIVQDGHC